MHGSKGVHTNVWTFNGRRQTTLFTFYPEKHASTSSKPLVLSGKHTANTTIRGQQEVNGRQTATSLAVDGDGQYNPDPDPFPSRGARTGDHQSQTLLSDQLPGRRGVGRANPSTLDWGGQATHFGSYKTKRETFPGLRMCPNVRRLVKIRKGEKGTVLLPCELQPYRFFRPVRNLIQFPTFSKSETSKLHK